MSRIIFVLAVAAFAFATFSAPAAAQGRSTADWNPFDPNTWRQPSSAATTTRSSRTTPMEGRNAVGSPFPVPAVQGVEPYISLTIQKDRRGSGR